MLDVHSAETLGQENLERLPENLIACIAEHALRRRIDERDPAVAVDQHDALRRRFEKRLTGGFASSQGSSERFDLVGLVHAALSISEGQTLVKARDRKSTRLNSSHLGISYAV